MFSRLFNIICFLRTWYYNCVFLTADGFAYARTLAGIASGMLNTQYLDSYCNLFLMIHALIHYGCTNDEIFDIMFFVMGDDNVILTNWTFEQLHAFMSFFEKHALSRFGMIMSTQKSILTALRNKIEMLGYQTAYGKGRRPIPKLVAQLCYPEHGPVDKFMSSRAVGMAYAAAGQDPTFHQFCYDIYRTFEPYRIDPNLLEVERIAKYLPGMFKMLDDITEFVNPEFFPTIEQVRSRYTTWQGELDQSKKWSPAHFINRPDVIPPSAETMAEYMTANSISFPEVDHFFSHTH